MTNFAYDGWHKIEILETEMKGKKVIREKLHLQGGVGAIITDEIGKIGLVKQFRPTIGFTTHEIPAGVLDKKNLSPLETLLEELEEECNITSEDILDISEPVVKGFYMMAGSSDAFMHLFRIHVKEQPKEVIVDDPDVEKTIWVTEEELDKMFLDGEFKDNKTVMAYLILQKEKMDNRHK